MKHVVIDLEMNPMAKQNRKLHLGCSRETIEIGAVLLDEQYHEIGSFKTYVKPQYNDVIEKRYEMLTGISTYMVQDAPVFEEAIKMFLSWCGSIPGEIKMYQWSENDLDQITRESTAKNIVYSESEKFYFEAWEDFQQEYDAKLGFERLLSLKDATMYAGVDFEGREHDALWDARNTATLLEILRTPDKCQNALQYVIDALNTKPVYTTLGECMHLGGYVFPG